MAQAAKKVIIKILMPRNRMLVVIAKVKKAKEVVEANNLLSSTEGDEEIWHKRIGHLNHSNLMTLAGRNMVKRLPKITTKEAMCEICMKGKQIRVNIPNKVCGRQARDWIWFIHTCGPIMPTYESGKRFIINFIDDYSRK